jgi:hypothetical protein
MASRNFMSPRVPGRWLGPKNRPRSPTPHPSHLYDCVAYSPMSTTVAVSCVRCERSVCCLQGGVVQIRPARGRPCTQGSRRLLIPIRSIVDRAICGGWDSCAASNVSSSSSNSVASECAFAVFRAIRPVRSTVRLGSVRSIQPEPTRGTFAAAPCLVFHLESVGPLGPAGYPRPRLSPSCTRQALGCKRMLVDLSTPATSR